jgi:hypothetical protein
MDTLALLCNLHADGPATLQRLRRLTVDSLMALMRLDAAELADALGWAPPAAERFLREAELLAERISGEPDSELEDEGEEELEDETSFEEYDTVDEGEDEDESAEDEEVWDEVEEEELPERAQAVLGTWRELDRTEPPAEPREFMLPRPAPTPRADLALRAASLPGLAPEGLRALAERGVTTLRAMVELGDVELARTLGFTFTRAKHLQFQAARALEGLPREPAVSEPRREPTKAMPEPVRAAIQSYSVPPREPFDTAGPFA